MKNLAKLVLATILLTLIFTSCTDMNEKGLNELENKENNEIIRGEVDPAKVKPPTNG